MTTSVLWETLRRELRGALLWALGLGLFGIVSVLILPDQAGMQQMADMLGSLPGFLWQMLGIDDLSVLATPAGFISFRFFLTAGILLAVWAVISGLNVTVNDEARGISNVVLSLPLSRQRVIVEKVLAYVPLAAVVAFGGLAGLAVGMVINPNGQTDLTPLMLSTVTLIPVMLLVLSLTVLVGAAIPRRGLVGAVAGAFVMASFLLKSVAGMAKSDFGDTMAQFSIFQHADALRVIREGFAPLSALIMLAIAALMVALAVHFYQRRDLAA